LQIGYRHSSTVSSAYRENEKTYAHIRPHSRSVKGPSCGRGAPGTQVPHRPPLSGRSIL
jgi:hypothetical protein